MRIATYLPTRLLALAGAALFPCASAQADAFVGANFSASQRSDSGFIPPDTMGAVGVDHFVELINGRYSVYRKSDGFKVQTSSLNTFWSNAGVTALNFAFDPRILFRHLFQSLVCNQRRQFKPRQQHSLRRLQFRRSDSRLESRCVRL
jgi:hypothetical protein